MVKAGDTRAGDPVMLRAGKLGHAARRAEPRGVEHELVVVVGVVPPEILRRENAGRDGDCKVEREEARGDLAGGLFTPTASYMAAILVV